MFCSNCGGKLVENAAFCMFCGAPVSSQQAAQAQLAEQTQHPVANEPQQVFAPPVQQPVPPVQQYAPPADPAPVEAAKPVKRKKFPVLPVIAAVVLVALVAAAALLLPGLMGGRTVWLTSEIVSESQYNVSTTSYKYTDDGRLEEYKFVLKYTGEYEHMGKTTTSFEYEYDEDGRLAELKVNANGKRLKCEYVYDKEGHLKGLKSENGTLKVKCDDEGRITSVTNEEDSSYAAKYSYHDNGALKKAEISGGAIKNTYRFNEQGKQVSVQLESNGQKMSVTETEYGDDSLPLKQSMTYYQNGEVSQKIEYRYSYEDGRLAEYEMTVETDGSSLTVKLEGEDGKLELVDFEGEGELFEGNADEIMEELEKNLEFEYVYDEHGNIVEQNVKIGDLFNSSITFEFTEVTLPRGRFAPTVYDPEYFIHLIQ